MRTKIIAVNAVIVAIVGLLSFVLVRASLMQAIGNTEQLLADGRRDVQGAAARFQLDALRAERWLADRAADPQTADPLGKATPVARNDAATSLCESIVVAAKSSPAFDGMLPSLVVLVDSAGKIVGRNGSALSRGEDLAAVYPALKNATVRGHSGSDVWANSDRNDHYVASYAPVRDEAGRIVGAVVIGIGLGDVLSRVSEATTGRGLVLMTPAAANGWQVAARSTNTQTSLAEAAAGKAKDVVAAAQGSGHALAMSAGDVIVAVTALEGFGDGKRAILVASAPSALIQDPASIVGSIWGVTALGILLVMFGGVLIGNYITRPINMLEEGLLAILNGQSDKRFELDHAELGGLAFRIDQLLNQLMGVEEDTTDDDGRPSKAPSAADFRDAMAVDEKRAEGAEGGVDPAVVAQLAAEKAGPYYARIYREYIEAKKSLGEAVEHISESAFTTRIQSMEKDAADKYGKPVRYQVKATGREVVLLVVPLA